LGIVLDHLHPSIHTIALLPSEERILKLRNNYWIGYGRAEQALSQLEDLLNFPKRVRMPNMLIIGPTNNGKTMIVEKFRRQNLPYESLNRNHEIIPVLNVQMPSGPSIQRFYSAIMAALGSPVTTYPSIAKNEKVALNLLKTTQTKVLIIDEIHNMLAGSNHKQREFLNILRFLGNELQLSIVGVGIKDAYLAIRSDDQFENRFEPLVLPLWNNDHEFMQLLISFQRILPLQKPSDLLDSDIRTLILARSEGIIGEISTLLGKATCEAIRSGKEYIDRKIIEQTDYKSPTERRRLYESMLY
jgi:type II secretory pathway predicted ATPase ExeA